MAESYKEVTKRMQADALKGRRLAEKVRDFIEHEEGVVGEIIVIHVDDLMLTLGSTKMDCYRAVGILDHAMTVARNMDLDCEEEGE